MIETYIMRYIIGGLVAWAAYIIVGLWYLWHRRLTWIHIRKMDAILDAMPNRPIYVVILRFVAWPYFMPLMLSKYMELIDEVATNTES